MVLLLLFLLGAQRLQQGVAVRRCGKGNLQADGPAALDLAAAAAVAGLPGQQVPRQAWTVLAAHAAAAEACN